MPLPRVIPSALGGHKAVHASAPSGRKLGGCGRVVLSESPAHTLFYGVVRLAAGLSGLRQRPHTGHGAEPSRAYSIAARLSCSAGLAAAGLPEPPTEAQVEGVNWYAPANPFPVFVE
jgi:hypothetical protein